MKTYTDETRADDAMRSTNRARCNARNYSPAVIVDGPGENEWTVMELAEAIAEDFTYRWSSTASYPTRTISGTGRFA